MTPSKQARVTAVARSWLTTPFRHQARIKGVGVDCANLLAAVYEEAGVIQPIDLGYYPPDWHLHRESPRFLEELEKYADKIDPADAQPGDVAMFRYGLHAAHGSIVLEWPRVIHAWRDVGMVVITEVTNGPLEKRLDSVWRMREPA